MKVSIARHVLRSINDANLGEVDVALLSACIAVDATAKRMFPKERSNGKRFKRCLRKYYWILEAMMGAGINLEETRFDNLRIGNNEHPDFADVLYHVFRCSTVHGDEIPAEFSLVRTSHADFSKWELLRGELHMPDRILWAMLGVVVFAAINCGESSNGTYYLSLGEDRFLIADWWGREEEFRRIASKYNVVRVKLDQLDQLEEWKGDTIPGDRTETVVVQQPYMSTRC